MPLNCSVRLLLAGVYTQNVQRLKDLAQIAPKKQQARTVLDVG